MASFTRVFPPGSLARSLLVAAVMAMAVITFCVAVNYRYFFQTQAYELGDHATNSLEVLRCKKLECYQGAYSRWGFHHPGPALFYWYALGELVFWQGLHLTQTPLNAQVLAALVLAAGFLGLGIGIVSRWVRSAFLIPVALLLVTLHLISMNLRLCMFDTWQPYVTPIPYFCLLLAAASVAAGQGEDLPVLVLAGCLLIHIHVGNPLYVLPLFILAYLGLLLKSHRQSAKASGPVSLLPSWAWRRFPRAHAASAVICLGPVNTN